VQQGLDAANLGSVEQFFSHPEQYAGRAAERAREISAVYRPISEENVFDSIANETERKRYQ
jgi:hypothetical protein